MTPQERRLVENLFERLATLERNPREPDAEQVIQAGLRRAPNATYALVQTVLLQEEALRQANERITELQSVDAPQQESGGFLESMRDTLFGGNNTRSSVPPVGGERPMGVPPGFQRGRDPYQPQGGASPQAAEPARSGGGSFLGTAAAAAVGVIGGSMLMNSLKGAFGGDQAKAQGLEAQGLGTQGLGDVSGKEASGASSNPWGDAASGDGNLAQQAGIDSVGRSGESERANAYQPAHEPIDEGAMLPEEDGFDLDYDTDFL
ncbi:MAG: DUF2076 domain-containing protein [Pseudorhodoplanes sp.]|uniref:DUF2076 domain-containing protein n=1 Tax=Pseudorhodoplanes sp. TaxID=1934341 RepID=UPI003D0A9B78